MYDVRCVDGKVFVTTTREQSAGPYPAIGYIHALRVGACFAVIVLHISLGIVLSVEPYTRHWWLGHWICLACTWAVPVFVMISGALLLDDTRNESDITFYRNRLYKIGIPLVFWTSVYFWCRDIMDGEHVTVVYVFKMLLEASSPYHTYFLFMIVWLYLLTPPLRRFVRRATPGQRWVLIAVILLLASAYSFTNVVFWQNKRCLFTFYIPYLGYYLAGYELRRTDPQKVSLRVLMGLVVLCAVYILVQTPWYIEYQGILHGMGVMGFFSPPVMILSLGVFWAAHIMGCRQAGQTGRWTGLMTRISPATFGIYLCHLAILIGMGKAFADQAGGEHFLGSVVVGSILLFLVSWGLVVVLLKIPYLRRIV